MNAITIPCFNLATGQFQLIPGRYKVNQDLLDIIQVLVNEKDLTYSVHSREDEFMYNFNTIYFVNEDTTFLETKTEHACIYKETGEIYIALDVIAKYLGKMWVNGRYYNTNYGVNGTVSLLLAILHEITHSRVDAKFHPPQDGETMEIADAAEEKHVENYTRKQMIAFMRKYALNFPCMELMHRLITDELAKSEVGRLIIEKQSSWFDEQITSIDRRGTQTLSIRAEFRRQYEPYASWPARTTRIADAIAEMNEELFEIENDKRRAKAIEEAERLAIVPPPPPPPVTIATQVPAPPIYKVPPPPPGCRVVPPPPPGGRVVPPPPPPPVTKQMVPPPPPPPAHMPPAPPIEAYDNWLAEEAALIQKAAELSNTSQPVHDNRIAEAIRKSPTYSAVPDMGCASLEQIAQKVGYKIFCHVFEQCGWIAGSDEWATPEMKAKYPTGFTNPEAALKPVDLSTIPGVKDYIAFYHTEDAHGRSTVEPFNAHVRGFLTSRIKLPMFKVVFKDGDKKLTRVFSPQNVNATKADKVTLSDGAVRAREKGSSIMWVNDPFVSDETVEEARSMKARGSKFVGFFEEYNYIPVVVKNRRGDV